MKKNTIVSLHQALKLRKISPPELIEDSIQKIKLEHLQLNALVADRFEIARSEAQELMPEFNKNSIESPFFGLPFTTKELIQVKGLPWTGGLLNKKNQKAPEDATVISRLKEKKAICVGVSNVPELGLWFESSNLIYGRTNNPYDNTRTPGGSSGGEGALIGSSCVPFGIGSDIGGSIRIPAFFCGICGHKPTNGLIPLTGEYPFQKSNADEFQGNSYPLTTVGPMARTVTDLKILFENLVGPDGIDGSIKPYPIQWSQIDLKKLSVFLLEDPSIFGARQVSEELEEQVLEASQILEKKGAKIKNLPRSVFKDAFSQWSAVLDQIDEASFIKGMNPDKTPNLWMELMKWSLGRPQHTFPVIGYALMEKYFRNEKLLSRAYKEHLKLRNYLQEIMGSLSIIMMPPHPRVAVKHNEPIFHPFDFCYTAIFNALKMPATVFPTRLNRDGLPMGVQIAAQPFQDLLTLNVAEILDQTFNFESRQGTES